MAGLAVLVGVVMVLHGALAHVGLGNVLAQLMAIPRRQFMRALGLLAGSFCVMLVYDVPGFLFARRLETFPPLRLRRVGFASFCAYALSHVLGAPALSAAAVRLRLYAQWRVPAAGIARIIALSGSMFALGLTGLLAFLLLLYPADLPLFGHAVPGLMLRGVGGGLAALLLAYVLAAHRRPALRLFGRNLALPGSKLALAQIMLSGLDITLACAIFYVMLPVGSGLSYAHVLGIYMAAFAGGLFSGLPGGVGVFDSLLLLGLTGYMSPDAILAAILLFRVLYFLAPASGAALCYALHEVWIKITKNKEPG